MIRGAVFAGLCLLGSSAPLEAGTLAEVDRLLAAGKPADGVVFEIMTFDDNGWRWALPLLREAARRITARHPGAELALVSHGAELFDLARGSNHLGKAELELLGQLHDAGLAIHVDGAYARWKRLGSEDFPAFVDVVPSADTLLEDYRGLGFAVIELEPPHAAD